LRAKTNYLNSLGRGATFKELSKGIVENVLIPLPAIEEQHHIADLFASVEELIQTKKQQLDLFDELVKSRFVELFDGKGYPTLKWNEVFNTTTGKLDSNAMVEDGEYPFFTCAKEVFRIDKYAFDQEALLLAGNNAAGKYDVKYYKGKFNAYQRTYVLGLKKDWSYQLFRYQLEDKLVYLQQQSLGGLTKYLTLKILGELEFIVPPMDKQNEFTAFVEQTDKSKSAVQQSIAELEELKKSLMQKYFG
jgi:restriction endonuclease S subunit